MKVLRVCGIGGLFHEMFRPEPNLCENLEIKNDLLDATSCFWAKHLEINSIQKLVNLLKINIEGEPYQSPQYLSIIANKDIFINRILKTPEILSNAEITPQEFFSQLEVVGILCKLYSDFVYPPFSLTLQDGFVLEESSSKEIYERCLNPRENPYFSFVADTVMPLIYEEDPDIIFLQGKISYYLMAIALLAKQKNPNVHICVTRHASEYYSLNKITDLLVLNDILFQMIDSIILEYFDEIEPALVAALSHRESLGSVSNLVFKNSSGKIVQTEFAPPVRAGIMDVFRRSPSSGADGFNNIDHIVDVHFDPYVKCHWNRCAFCGINKKYRHQSIRTSYDTFIQKIQSLQDLSQQYKYIWFIDEAIEPDKLRSLAEHFLSENLHIIWQARCRADKRLLENGLPELLARSGLRELRIGLESASYFILKQMDKFDDDFSLEMMEEIVRVYQANNIAIHCPIIIGFPQETAAERQKTYEFLSHLCEISPLFTFNLNILNLDISSRLYRHWEQYQLERIAFTCPPKHFLGNCVAWISAEQQQMLYRECQLFMREHLYPWLPEGAITPPTILYRLSETSRNTLRWKAGGAWIRSKQSQLFSAEMELQLSEELSITRQGEVYLVYSWTSHHYMHGNHWMLKILDKFRTPYKVSKAIRELTAENPDIYSPDELIVLLQKFHLFQFLTGTYQFHVISTEKALKDEYDRIYTEENFIYSIETDACLKKWARELKPGRALELGVGMGKNINFLRERGFQITGVDFSDVAIQKLQKRYPCDECTFVTADIRDFPIEKESYSLIICSLVLSYLSNEDLIVLTRRMISGLVPGGLIYFTDLSQRDPLSKVPLSQTSDRRNFFTIDKLAVLFSDFDVIELSDVFRKEPRRIGCQGAFGLICFLGKKPEKLKGKEG